MIYSKNGISLSDVYEKNGSSLSQAFDVNGTRVYGGGASNTLRVVNYNVGQWYIGNGYAIPTANKSEYTALQTTIFNQLDADICCMQEATDAFCQDGTLANPFLGAWFDDIDTTNGDVNYKAHKIATKGYSMSGYESIDFVNGRTNYMTYEKCYVNVGGKNVCILNTHLSTGTYHNAQAAELLETVSNEEYFILCGDFNTVIESLSDSDYVNCIKPFIDAGYSDANCGAFGIFPTYYATSDPNADYKPATDHIIVSSNISIKNAFVNTVKLTDGIEAKIDHVPLVAVLEIN